MWMKLETEETRLAFATCEFDLAFEFDDELTYAGLIHRLNQAKRFIENATLVFRKVWLTGNAAEFAIVKCHSRWSDTLHNVFHYRDRHRWNSGSLDHSCDQTDRLMTHS